MTRGEAIMKLSSLMMQCGMLMPIEWVKKNGEGSPVSEAVIMAQNALREQEERSKGCWFCNDKYTIMSGNRITEDLRHIGCTASFCPNCGKKLEAEG